MTTIAVSDIMTPEQFPEENTTLFGFFEDFIHDGTFEQETASPLFPSNESVSVTSTTPEISLDLFNGCPKTPPSEQEELHPLLRPPTTSDLASFSNALLQSDMYLDMFLTMPVQPQPSAFLYYCPPSPSPCPDGLPASSFSTPQFDDRQSLPSNTPPTQHMEDVSVDNAAAFAPTTTATSPVPPSPASSETSCVGLSSTRNDSASSSSSANKRRRHTLNKVQREYVISIFNKNNTPGSAVLREIAENVGISSLPPSPDFLAVTCTSSTRRGTKKQRHILTKPQRNFVMSIYHKNNTPTSDVLKTVADELGITFRRAQFWFQNRRANDRKRARRCGEL
ncbi:hypothetical protein HDU98_003113 [Podochytrium sp. JEL0797]|nr:hypothetical protein HDU98_003113 [Podochytrium sp. JEL0797]